MKKITLLMVALLTAVGTMNATQVETVVWEGSEAVSWNTKIPGTQYEPPISTFTGLAEGDVIKIYTQLTEEGKYGDPNYVVTYKAGDGWEWTDLSTTINEGIISYTVASEQIANEIAERGLVFRGQAWTVTQITVTKEVTYESVTLFQGSQEIGDWNNNVNLSYENKGQLSEIFMNDKIRITYKDAGEDATVRVANPADNQEKYEDASQANATLGDNQIFDYTITSAVILEKIQQNGILGRGKNITITKIELLKEDGRYDAVPVTIGEDGIATFGSSKKLDFSGTNITPYYASAVEPGKVTLTPVSDKTTWAYEGYILKGNADTYEVPVSNNAFYPSGNFLKTSNDYSATVAASTDGKYHYIFAKKGTNEPAFYKLTSSHELEAHKAYLETATNIGSTNGSRSITIDFGDGTTAIMDVLQDNVKQQLAQEDGVYYTLQGTRVQPPTKGLYILNGKKIIVK